MIESEKRRKVLGKSLDYILRMRPVLNRDALFADGSDMYRKFTKTDAGWKVRLRFRTARANAWEVRIVTDRGSYLMKLCGSDKLFDYYERELIWPECGDTYYFTARSGKTYAVYNRCGASDTASAAGNFRLIPDFDTPAWAKGAVMYQIFVDRFYNGDPANDVVDGEYYYIQQRAWHENDWEAVPRTNDVCHFYGGDLQGVLDKLDYLQDLGIEVLYLNPVFVSPSNHKYDTQDYDHIDPHYGKIIHDEGETLDWHDSDNRHATRYITRTTDPVNLEASNEFFAEFMEQVHARGMRVILDGVFNHCGSFNKWIDRECIYEKNGEYAPGAYISADSPYRDYFHFRSNAWPYNKDYEGWWEHPTLPKLNYEMSGNLCNEIIRVARKWVSPPYNVDGWRLDVAADLGYSREFNHAFWRRFRREVKDANPNAVILAENYADSSEWLMGDQWDTIMNYEAFMEPVTWFLTGMEKHSDFDRDELYGNYEEFRRAMTENMAKFSQPSLLSAMNELSNHDHSRFLTRTNRKAGRLATAGPEAASEGICPAVMREAVIMQMTWPGAPTVYYGDEAGLCGWTDPDNRRTYPWGREDQEMILFHKEAIRMHRESSALRTGSFKLLGGAQGVVTYGRFDACEHYVVAVNNNQDRVQIRIPVWQIGITGDMNLVQVLMSNESAFTTERKKMRAKDGYLKLDLPRTSAVVIRTV